MQTGPVQQALAELQVSDIHTHLFDPGMGDLLLTGIDELLTYHYHVAELFRVAPSLDYEEFWNKPVQERADFVWRELFVERCPWSEVGLGVVQMLSAFGLDPNAPSLDEARAWFAERTIRERVDLVFERAGVKEVVMTNDPLDSRERATWEAGFDRDSRFHAALRLDSALIDWPRATPDLESLGYRVADDLSAVTTEGVRAYLREWALRMNARYMAISLPPSFRYPDPFDSASHLIEHAAIPIARELGIPIALMIGVRRNVNPRLELAGDGSGRSDVSSLERLANDHHDVRFLATLLSREDQHELCVAARKFKNIVPFGCWWFVNNPSLIHEITAMRLDMLGPSFIPQHSDARVLEQLVFKWARSRQIIGEVMATRHEELATAGHAPSDSTLRGDLQSLLGGGLLEA